MVSVGENHATIQEVLHAIDAAEGLDLKGFMGNGDAFDKFDLIGRQHFPYCQVTPTNQVAHPDRMDAH